MSFDIDQIPVVTLFRGKTFNHLTSHITNLNTEPPTEWFRTDDLLEQIDVSRTAFQNNQRQVAAYGLLERSKDPEEAPMPRYRIPDSPVVELLRSFDKGYDPTDDADVSDGIKEVSLPDLMESNGRARLIGWLLFYSDPTELYSKSGLAEVAPVGHTTVRGHIDTITNHGIVITEGTFNDSQTYTEYRFNQQSHVADILYLLNEAVIAHAMTYKNG